MTLNNTIDGSTPSSSNYNIIQTSIQSLPNELLIYILSLLNSPEEAAKCSLVCKHWEQLLDERSLWDHFISRDYPWLKEEVKIEDPKSVYKNKYLFDSNMLQNIHSETLIQTQHPAICSLISTQQGDLISINRAGRAWVLDMDTKEPRYPFSLGEGILNKVIMTSQNQLIYILSGNLMIRSLAQSDEPILLRQLDPQFPIMAFSINDQNQLITAFTDGQIKIWDLNQRACIKTMQLSKNKLCTFFYIQEKKEYVSFNLIFPGQHKIGNELNFWDEKGSCLKTYSIGIGSIYNLEYIKNYHWLISASKERLAALNSKIQIWDLNTGNCLRTFQQVNVFFLTLMDDPTKLLASSKGGEIVLWDTSTGAQLCVLQNKPQPQQMQNIDGISSITQHRGNVIFSNGGGLIHIWDFQKIPSDHPSKKPKTHK